MLDRGGGAPRGLLAGPVLALHDSSCSGIRTSSVLRISLGRNTSLTTRTSSIPSSSWRERFGGVQLPFSACTDATPRPPCRSRLDS